MQSILDQQTRPCTHLSFYFVPLRCVIDMSPFNWIYWIYRFSFHSILQNCASDRERAYPVWGHISKVTAGDQAWLCAVQRLDDQYSVLAAVLLHPIGLRCTHIKAMHTHMHNVTAVAWLKAAGMIYEILFCNETLGRVVSTQDTFFCWRNSYRSLHISQAVERCLMNSYFIVKTMIPAELLKPYAISCSLHQPHSKP